MASEPESNPVEEGEDDDNMAPSHHPSPPSDELFDISTTVDPSYIISLIRKLLPQDVKNGHDSDGNDAFASDQGLKTDHMKERVVSACEDEIPDSSHVTIDTMDTLDGFDELAHQEKVGEVACGGFEDSGIPVREKAWEEYGCILWDLAANRTHAELMVQNLMLEVLLANLLVSQSMRVTEISLGILGNLACHEIPMKQIVSTGKLIEIVVDQLFLDDTPCLCEACRLLTLGLQGSECVIWAKALQSEHNLSRIIWVAENTLNPQLLEKVANSCITAAVLIANILIDSADLTSEISHDLPFLEGLLDILPFASDDLEARSAIWSIMARLLVQVQEIELSSSSLQQYVSVFVSKSDLIEDDLLDHQSDDYNESNMNSITSDAKLNARTTALKRIINLLNQWITSKDCNMNNLTGANHDNNGAVERLLNCCRKYTESL